MEKKLVFFTNCQGKFIYDNYLSTISFFENYETIFIRNYDISTTDFDIISKADIFIFQPVNNYTVDLGDDKNYLIPKLKKTCIKISFPCLYTDIFPLYYEVGIVGGEIIEKYKTLGFSLDKILEFFDKGKLNFNMQSRFEKSMAYLINREKICNIKVSDFILKNYKDYKLFDTQNHPNGILASYVAKNICHILNINFMDLCIFNEADKCVSVKYPDSIYSKKELLFNYVINDNSEYYKKMIIEVYNNPSIIKYKYAIG
jgi:hypothetical protein